MRPILGLRYDLRSAPFGKDHSTIYSAMMDQVRWADRLGFMTVTFSEHHASDDGYLPSPLMAAAAALGATTQIRAMVSALLLPLYDPIRLAEDMAVLDLLSGGRIDLTIGAGYRKEEFDLLDRPFNGRFKVIEESVEALRKAWTGEPFTYRGRTVQVLPKPSRPGGPMLLIGGSSEAAARRAARIGDGFIPTVPELVQVYIDACNELGKAPGISGGASGPMFIHVSEDPDRAWAQIAPYALHESNSYGKWLAENGNVGPYTATDDAAALRASGVYAVMTPAEAIAHAESTFMLMLHPLMGGLDPDIAAESLDLVEAKVLPHFDA